MPLPPLRERREDIPSLASHFLRIFTLRFHKPLTDITAEAMDLLCRYHWPGNVRELRNAIERAVILEEGAQLTSRFLPERVSVPSSTASAGPADAHEAFALPPGGVSLERVEESLVRQAIAQAGGNQTRAAQLLDISRDALRYKLKKFGID